MQSPNRPRAVPAIDARQCRSVKRVRCRRESRRLKRLGNTERRRGNDTWLCPLERGAPPPRGEAVTERGSDGRRVIAIGLSYCHSAVEAGLANGDAKFRHGIDPARIAEVRRARGRALPQGAAANRANDRRRRRRLSRRRADALDERLADAVPDPGRPGQGRDASPTSTATRSTISASATPARCSAIRRRRSPAPSAARPSAA